MDHRFRPLQLPTGTDPHAPGDVAGELGALLRAGVDGFSTDNPSIGAAAFAGWRFPTAECTRALVGRGVGGGGQMLRIP